MGRPSSMHAMNALAAVLSAPNIVVASNALFARGLLDDPPAAATVLPADDAPVAVGAAVYNPQNEMIGNIAAVLPAAGDRDGGVVLSLGGFRGVAGKRVAVRRELITVVDDKRVIAGATKDQLMLLPDFRSGSRS